MAIPGITCPENKDQHDELISAKKDNTKGSKGVDVENKDQKEAEVKLAEDENRSMSHYYKFVTSPASVLIPPPA